MLPNDLTVVDNQSSITLPGSLGSKVYNLLNLEGGKAVRRVAATALTTPQTLMTSHQTVGKGVNSRLDTLVRHDFALNNADLAATGGIIPSLAVTLTIRRNLVGGLITNTHVKDAVGALLSVLTAAGQLDKLLNAEI
jgi:hypothetical protein